MHVVAALDRNDGERDLVGVCGGRALRVGALIKHTDALRVGRNQHTVRTR
eukprot:SAG11_NODE_28451_length_321_cov_1.162162_1_plen_49_part_01